MSEQPQYKKQPWYYNPYSVITTAWIISDFKSQNKEMHIFLCTNDHGYYKPQRVPTKTCTFSTFKSQSKTMHIFCVRTTRILPTIERSYHSLNYFSHVIIALQTNN